MVPFPKFGPVHKGANFVCHLPEPVKALSLENGCLIATLESGRKHLIPAAPSADTPKN